MQRVNKKTKKVESAKASKVAEIVERIRKRHGSRPSVTFEEEETSLPRYELRLPALSRLLGGGIPRGAIVELFGAEDSSKAQPLDAKVLTPSGFVRMGELERGHLVIGSDGRAHRVLDVADRGLREVFRVRFSDGVETECCEEHLWHTRTVEECARNLPGAVRNLAEIRRTLIARLGSPTNRKMKNDYPNHRVPLVAPVRFRSGPFLPLDPYLLGLLLGDGSLPLTGSPSFHKPEVDLINSVIERLPGDDEGRILELAGRPAAVRIVRKGGLAGKGRSETQKILDRLGLLGTRSLTKFVPVAYLSASIESRRGLLRGLLDSDGCVPTPGGPGVDFGTSSPELLRAAIFLVRSLGGIAFPFASSIPAYRMRDGEKRRGARAYRVRINFPDGWCPVSSEKHLAKWAPPRLIRYRSIESVEPAGTKPCRCIRVDSPDGLYVTDDFVVTHNSTSAVAFAADVQQQSPPGRKTVVLVNFEMRVDWRWLRRLGLDVSRDAFVQLKPRDLQEGVADALDLLETGEVCCVIFDSVYAAAARARRAMMAKWKDAKSKGAPLGVEAVLWGEAWTTFKGALVDHGAVAIAVNQVREVIEIGGPPSRGFGGERKTTTPRGRALKFYAWIRLELHAGPLLEDDGEGGRRIRKGVDGRRVTYRVVKNATADEARGRCSYDLIRGEGFDLEGALIEEAIRAGLIEGTGGGRFRVLDREKVHGRAAVERLVRGDSKLRDRLREAVAEWARRPSDPKRGASDVEGSEEEADSAQVRPDA